MATSAASNKRAPCRDELSKRSVPELRQLCDEWNLPRSGKKDELLSRLREAGGPRFDGLTRPDILPAVPEFALDAEMRRDLETAAAV